MPAKTKLVDFTATGTGTALIQISYQYNIRDIELEPSFDVHVQIYSEDSAARLIMDVCAEFTGDGEASNMALMEISLPSGYIVDEESLDEIRKVKRVSVSNYCLYYYWFSAFTFVIISFSCFLYIFNNFLLFYSFAKEFINFSCFTLNLLLYLSLIYIFFILRILKWKN